MLTEGATVVDNGIQNSFAMEYHGPPITGDIPRAVPINVDSIPVAAVLSEVPLSHKLSLPVVQPILTSNVTKSFSKELKLGFESTVSPTSVIFFEPQYGNGEDSISKELVSEHETTPVSPTSAIAIEYRGPSNHGLVLSAELSSSGALEVPHSKYKSDKTSDVNNGLAVLGSSSVTHDHSRELSGVGRSGTLGFSDSFGKSREFSGTSRALRDANPYKDGMTRTESILSMDYPSSRVSSLKNGDCNNELVIEARRAQFVTFPDIESEDDGVNEDFNHVEPEIDRPNREPMVKVKRKVAIDVRKEIGSPKRMSVLFVPCGAKYCSNCVLRAMGSMP